MSYYREPRYWIQSTRKAGNSVTICSCVLCGTDIEQNSSKRERTIMWIKDAAAGAGLMLFMVSAFVLASGAHAVLHHVA